MEPMRSSNSRPLLATQTAVVKPNQLLKVIHVMVSSNTPGWIEAFRVAGCASELLFTIVSYILESDEQYQVDLMVTARISVCKNYVLVEIDCFSKCTSCVSLGNKQVMSNIKTILRTFPRFQVQAIAKITI